VIGLPPLRAGGKGANSTHNERSTLISFFMDKDNDPLPYSRPIINKPAMYKYDDSHGTSSHYLIDIALQFRNI
jgi:hypothetical protein